jgi:sporulation protein YlmC with PRC-barrel domain
MKNDDDRDGRDAAGIGPYAREREHLVALSTLDKWTVSDGEPDIRGWEVRTVSGRQLGTVQDLLIDSDAGEVVLLDVDLPGSTRHTFVPIRATQIDRGRRIVLMDSADMPETDLSRVAASPASGQPSESGIVRYPTSDREVAVDNARNASATPDDVLPPDDVSPPESTVERRRAERRKIDRISTEI